MESALRELIGGALGAGVASAARVHGGDVASSWRLELDDGRHVFAKTHPSAPAEFFTTEATGLRWLAETRTARVPSVLYVRDEQPNALVLEWIDTAGGRHTRADEVTLGRQLAALHRSGAPSFGREDRRTTGSRGLPNEPCATWAEFYATQRLLPLAGLAARALPADAIAALERLAARLLGEPDAFGGSGEPAARLHGDLWAGNRIVDSAGESWLIDPAAHGGHREFDLAMMRLFGGFDDACFAAYAESFPLSAGWRERILLHQIAPLVVHAVKFGGGYVGAAQRAIATYA